jgi:hypothetical protein
VDDALDAPEGDDDAGVGVEVGERATKGSSKVR